MKQFLQILAGVAGAALYLWLLYLKLKSSRRVGEGWPTRTKPPISLFGDSNRSTRR
jgi:hypothetical protein